MINQIRKAMQDADQWVVQFEYRDSKGNLTTRTVSPIRLLANGRFLALCLCREEPRQFYFERCQNVVLKPASECLMPMAI